MAEIVKVLAEVVLQADDGSILLLRRGRGDKKRPGQWDVPGGHAETGEEFRAAAVRETLEEASIAIRAPALQLLYSYTKLWDTSVSCSWLFFGVHTPKQDPVLSPEHCEFAWVSLHEAIDMIEYDLQKDALIYIRDNQLLN